MNIGNLKEMNERLKGIKAGDIMSHFAITIKEGATISDLAHLLMRFKVSGVPVLDKDKALVGIITATDLFKIMETITEALGSGLESSKVNEIFIRDTMSKNICTVTEETSLLEIVQLMCGKNVHTLPVMSNKEVVGIIGRRDVLNAFYVGKK